MHWPVMVSRALSRVWQYVKLSDVSLGTRPRYSLVADEDIKQPTKQTNNPCNVALPNIRGWAEK